MPSKSKKPAARGFVNNIILESLLSGDKYGYEIIKEVEIKSNGKIILKQPSLYSSLKRFEAKGFITSYWGDSNIGGRRHYYTITETGKKYYYSLNGINKAFDELIDEKEDNEEYNEIENITIEELNKENNESIKHEINVDDEEYDVFKILESHNEIKQEKLNKNSEFAIQQDLFTDNNTTTSEIFEEQKIDTTSLKVIKEENIIEEEVEHKENNEILETKTIPLIKEREQEFFNWEELKRKIAQKSANESNKLNNDELVKESAQLNEEMVVENKETKKEVKIIVDEFGILKSADDALPKTPRKIIDNVGIRLDSYDPINLTKTKKKEEEIKFEINTKPVTEFNEQTKILEDKLNLAIQKQKGKNQLNLKKIMGDILVDDEVSDNSEEIELQIETPTLEFENTSEVITKNKIRATSYSALESALKANGFNFKPYSYEVEEENKKVDFVLINKVKLHFGVLLFLLISLQTAIFSITLSSLSYNFKAIDYILMTLSVVGGLLVSLVFVLPYIFNTKKRKFNDFNLKYSLFFGMLVFIAFSIITYAVNSIVGLTLDNVKDYIFTLFLPIVIFTNFLISPLVFNILLNNKKYY